MIEVGHIAVSLSYALCLDEPSGFAGYNWKGSLVKLGQRSSPTALPEPKEETPLNAEMPGIELAQQLLPEASFFLTFRGGQGACKYVRKVSTSRTMYAQVRVRTQSLSM